MQVTISDDIFITFLINTVGCHSHSYSCTALAAFANRKLRPQRNAQANCEALVLVRLALGESRNQPSYLAMTLEMI